MSSLLSNLSLRLPAVTLWSRFQAVATTVELQNETGTTAPLLPPSLPWLNILVMQRYHYVVVVFGPVVVFFQFYIN